MKILLVHPPIREELPATNFPFGIGYIAASLLQASHTVEVLEVNAFRWKEQQLRKKIRELDFDIVGISAIVTRYNYVKWLIPIIKEYKPKAKVIVGGTLATTATETLLKKTLADIAVIGEGDVTIKELLQAIESEDDLRKVKGIAFRNNGDLVYTPLRERIRALDLLPFPPYHLFPMNIYIDNMRKCYQKGKLRRNRLGQIIAVRGCPFSCVFCTNSFRQGVFARTPDNIIQEIKLLIKDYSIDGIMFSDELTLFNKNWMYNLCDNLIKENLPLKFFCNGRADLIDIDILLKMKKAGFVEMGFGFESGSQTALDSINKKTTVDQAINAVNLCHKVGLDVDGSFMVNTPGETRQDILKTVDFFRITDLEPGGIGFIATPYPGTALYQKAIEEAKIKDEEEFLTKLDSDATKLIINFTKLTDEQLLKMKDAANWMIRINYCKRHPLYTIKIIKDILSRFFSHFNHKGIPWTVRYMKNRISSLVASPYQLKS